MDFKQVSFESGTVDGRTIMGYAAKFGNIDLVGDSIEKGAFKRTLEGSQRIKTFYNHMIPIGKPVKMIEDETGLYTESVISRTAKGDEILELVKDGVIGEMSIAYDVMQESWDAVKKVRKLKELKLYEFGPVDFPANPEAVITGMKALSERVNQNREISGLEPLERELKTLLESIEKHSLKSTAAPPSRDTEIKKLASVFDDLSKYYEEIRSKHYGR
jgi:HK97 family phage prohead protease